MLDLHKDIRMADSGNQMENDKDSQQNDGTTVILCAGVFDTQRQLAHAGRHASAEIILSARKRLMLRMLNKDRKQVQLRVIK